MKTLLAILCLYFVYWLGTQSSKHLRFAPIGEKYNSDQQWIEVPCDDCECVDTAIINRTHDLYVRQ